MDKSYLHLYMFVCVCMHVWELKKVYSSKVGACLLAEHIYLYVWVNIEVHEKLSSLNDGKHANFIRTDVFSVAVNSPMLTVVWSWTWQNVRSQTVSVR